MFEPASIPRQLAALRLTLPHPADTRQAPCMATFAFESERMKLHIKPTKREANPLPDEPCRDSSCRRCGRSSRFALPGAYRSKRGWHGCKRTCRARILRRHTDSTRRCCWRPRQAAPPSVCSTAPALWDRALWFVIAAQSRRWVQTFNDSRVACRQRKGADARRLYATLNCDTICCSSRALSDIECEAADACSANAAFC